MTLEELIAKMTPEMHNVVRQAVELGRWPNGQVLDPEQREMCLQAMIVYETKRLPEEQRTGYINTEKLEKTLCDDDVPQSLTWVDKH
ncbi:MAG TPA: DUF1315 family protein [Pseudomonadales bacterium]|nr:DUF1315 family protein [Pseudomonadales bacterium]